MAYYGDQNKGGVNGHYYHVFGTVRPSLFNGVDIFLKDCSVAAVLQDSERCSFVIIIMPIGSSKYTMHIGAPQHCVVWIAPSCVRNLAQRQYITDE